MSSANTDNKDILKVAEMKIDENPPSPSSNNGKRAEFLGEY